MALATSSPQRAQVSGQIAASTPGNARISALSEVGCANAFAWTAAGAQPRHRRPSALFSRGVARDALLADGILNGMSPTVAASGSHLACPHISPLGGNRALYRSVSRKEDLHRWGAPPGADVEALVPAQPDPALPRIGKRSPMRHGERVAPKICRSFDGGRVVAAGGRPTTSVYLSMSSSRRLRRSCRNRSCRIALGHGRGSAHLMAIALISRVSSPCRRTRAK